MTPREKKPRGMTTVGDAIGDLPPPTTHSPSRAEVRAERARENAEIMAKRWDDGRVLELPRKGKDALIPRVLVERTAPALSGPNGEEICYFPGSPVISLFTGCGGMDLGVEQAGMTAVVQHEVDESACATLMANRPHFFRHAALIQGDIYRTPTEMLLREGGLRVGEAHLLCGGPPCQGFSICGRRDPKDRRNDLIFEFLRVVREAKPKFFCMENVPGILTAAKGQYFRAFLKAAHDCFYELVYGLLNAVEYGVPQTRVRFFCMGTRRDMFALDNIIASLPGPECFSNRDLKRIELYRTDLLRELRCYDEELALLYHAPGIRYFPDRPILIPPRPISGTDICDNGRTKGFIEFFRRLRAEEPDRIVTKETRWLEPAEVLAA